MTLYYWHTLYMVNFLLAIVQFRGTYVNRYLIFVQTMALNMMSNVIILNQYSVAVRIGPKMPPILMLIVKH